MTGMEILALASALQAGGKMIKGGLDWAQGGKASDLELQRLNRLKAKMNEDVIKERDLQFASQHAGRQASSTMNQAVASARGAMAFQGMGSSGIASQLGLGQAQQLADAQVGAELASREHMRRTNQEHRDKMEDQIYDYKAQLADRRRAVMEQGRANFFGGGMDLLTLGAQSKILNPEAGSGFSWGDKVEDPASYAGRNLPKNNKEMDKFLKGRNYINTGSDVEE
tara:strand:- start:143 stop:817 length:675 start_codon:yes stop_codon:yes gene_type:complete